MPGTACMYRLFSHNVMTMETRAIGWPPWLITYWYLWIFEQLSCTCIRNWHDFFKFRVSKWNQWKWPSNCIGFYGHHVMWNSSIWYTDPELWLLPCQAAGLGAPQTHLIDTLNRYTQGVPTPGLSPSILTVDGVVRWNISDKLPWTNKEPSWWGIMWYRRICGLISPQCIDAWSRGSCKLCLLTIPQLNQAPWFLDITRFWFYASAAWFLFFVQGSTSFSSRSLVSKTLWNIKPLFGSEPRNSE